MRPKDATLMHWALKAVACRKSDLRHKPAEFADVTVFTKPGIKARKIRLAAWMPSAWLLEIFGN
jgi:hypothetical protein